MSQEIKIEKKASEVIQPASAEEARQAIRSKQDLSGAALSGLNLRNLTAAGAVLRKTDLSESDLSHGVLIYPNFFRSHLKGTAIHNTLFLGGDLVRTELPEADLHASALIGVDAREANFEGANLHKAALLSVNLQDANFTDADLSDVRLATSDVTGADFTNANVSGALSYKVDWSKAKVPPSVIPAPLIDLPRWAWAIIIGSFIGLIALIVYSFFRKNRPK